MLEATDAANRTEQQQAQQQQPQAGPSAVVSDGAPAQTAGPRGPSIALPTFAAPSAAAANPEAAKLFFRRLLAWHAACGAGRPLRDYLDLAMSEPVGQKWAADLLDDEPEATTDLIRDRFLQRFAAEVRKPATVARDKLHSGKVTQKAGQDVVDYVGVFKDVVRDVPDMTHGEKIRWFQAGLLPVLRKHCACDYRGREFDTLDDCIQHAYGEERKLKIEGVIPSAVANRTKPTFAAASLPQRRSRPEADDGDEPATKRPRQDTGPTVATASAGKGPSRGRGRGPGRGGGHGCSRGGRGGGRFGGGRGGAAGNSGPRTTGQRTDPHEVLTSIHDLSGRRITLAEYYWYKNGGYCFNCFKRGHHSRDCKADRKPYDDSRQGPMAE